MALKGQLELLQQNTAKIRVFWEGILIVAVRELGAGHPRRLDSWEGEALAHFYMRMYDPAATCMRRVAAGRRSALGSHDRSVAAADSFLSEIEEMQEEVAEQVRIAPFEPHSWDPEEMERSYKRLMGRSEGEYADDVF
jgi:hypothetical protein